MIKTIQILKLGLLISACSTKSIETTEQFLTPEIHILGKTTDTTFLYGTYKDEGAFVNYEQNGRFLREELNGKGAVNTASLGTYYIDYDFTDSFGNNSTTATRTVQVVEHKFAYLFGIYDVTCNCTVTAKEGIKNEQIINTYTAEVSSSSNSNDVTLKYLRVGPIDLQPNISIIGDTIIMNYYSPELQLTNGNCGNGYILPNKNSFVINSAARPYSDKKTYLCKNTFIKKLQVKIKAE